MKIILMALSVFIFANFGYMKFTNQNINDIGLSVFALVKQLKGESVKLNAIESLNLKPLQHKEWDVLLQKHVSSNGEVDYKGFMKDSVQLNEYLDLLSLTTPNESWTINEKLAYWINAYNAFTVKLIIDYYPVESIKDIGGNIVLANSPWDIKFFEIGGVAFDLNTIEHQILRKQFDEPRIHFAINCAAISCPKLRNEAYKAEDLGSQLNIQAIAFLHTKGKNDIQPNALQLSKIFDWFKSDFTKNQTLIEFLQPHTKVTIKPNAKISFLEYDWSLNE